MTVTQRIQQVLRALSLTLASAALLLLCSAGSASAADNQKRTLLSTDGTLYEVRAGTVADLEITNLDLDPDTYVVLWGSVAQDGTRQQGVLQGSPSGNPKTSLDLTFDEPTGSFVILWREDSPILNQIRLGRSAQGRLVVCGPDAQHRIPPRLQPADAPLAPDRHDVRRQGQEDPRRTARSSRSSGGKRRSTPRRATRRSSSTRTSRSDSVQIYDLPVLIGGGGPTSYDGVAAAAYLYPALQLEGPSGAFLASFADLHANLHYVVRIDFPTNLGNPNDPKNPVFERRRIPVVGVIASGPIAFQSPTT